MHKATKQKKNQGPLDKAITSHLTKSAVRPKTTADLVVG